ncbi:Asp/Glu/hydantoin racemase [Parvibaculum sp.]|uniref:maleate cis-trans isomerase family protein n=1 Tax=Parvibaculum sp. TaxID=2024848 RepID=UPI003210ED75
MTIRIGHITPSSNTALEPLTYAMNEPLKHRMTHHFSRMTVTHLALSGSSEAQFQPEPMLAAARLLADAPLDAILWNGTSASWRGLENDLRLCEAITRETGIAASTTTIAFYKTFRENNWRRIALAVPYTPDITEQIGVEYARQGFDVVGAASLGLRENIQIGGTDAEPIRKLLREAARSEPDCIAVVCTNFNATEIVDEMETELGVPIVDSIAITFREACLMTGLDLRVPGWGKILAGH